MPSAKVRAADSVLNHTAKAIEIEDLEARAAALKIAAGASKNMKNYQLYCALGV
jgi:hypothetical protein